MREVSERAGEVLRKIAGRVAVDRRQTHGNYEQQACCHGKLLTTIIEAAGGNVGDLDPEELSYLAHVTGKLSRYSCGDRTEVDHPEDIAGYSGLEAARIGEGGGWLKQGQGDV